MAYCYNFKLMFFFYAMISSERSVTSASSSTSGSTTLSTSVSLQSTTSLTSETNTISSSTSSPIAVVSTHDATSISPSTSVTTTVTSTSVFTTSSPSVSTTISSPSASEPTATSTSGITGPSSSTSPTTTTTSTPVPTTPSSSATMSENTKTSDTTAFSSSTSLTTTSSSTSESTTLSLSASASSTSEATQPSSPSSPPTTATSTSESTTLSQSASTTGAASSTSETTKPSSPSSLTATSTSMSDSTTLSLSASTTTATSSTSETTTMSSPVSEITTPLSPTSPETTAASTFKSTTPTTPPNSIVVDLGSHTLGLNFSIRVNLSFFDEIKTPPVFANLSANLTEQLTPIYKNTPGFKYIQIYEINGSRNIRYGKISADEIQLLVMSNELADANYSVFVSAATNLDVIIAYINASVINQLKNLSILGGDVNDIYLTMQKELESLNRLSVCQYSTPKPCPYGFNCMDWTSGSVLCSDRCDRQACMHGTCYIDHQNEIVTKCRCPVDDDGYVYSGARCEHKALSQLIIITSAVGGAVLIAAFLIICLICIKLRRNREQLDNILLDNLPNYSKYFPHNSAFQPHYGYDLPMGSRHIIESRDLDATPSYIPDSNDGQENTGFFYQENDTPSGDYVSDPIRDKHTYNYIGLNTRFSIRRPQLR